ncbi:putative hydroxymethylpyrimidine transporter CytX [Anaerococcus sp. WCA-380-WT-2B]|uniref:Putative hydroxymethylpyrimidine transporter CytX n=1 Tax=Anaerococcus porci TaxID=2652269 RepID=A0A6N7VT92_9FIRM|nr:putative hydroxymethylpyrimidine transporter CytX [Anaerococcus porci]MSS78076.1 putative hydroxymethylpyrimidine transporter CytX [Anaerococcus porci]
MKKQGVLEDSLIWFGAAVSIAEIITGTYFSSLGFTKAMAAIIIGHIFGCFLLYLAAIIGARLNMSAMESVKYSFGSKGFAIFAIINIIQLVAWTGIMIYDGAIAAGNIFNIGNWIWSLVIGFLIIFWIFIGIKNLGPVNKISMTLLFVLSLVLAFVIFKNRGASLGISGNELSFGNGVELSIAMPLSWIPLIADYSKDYDNYKKSSLASVLAYGIVSFFMYTIGLSASLFAGTNDIGEIMLKSGMGVLGLLIIVLSTVTTTFLDAYSAGVSANSLNKNIDIKKCGILVTIIGTIGAIIFPMDDITDFLYFIGSVFAPMIAILIADFFIIKIDRTGEDFYLKNIIIWIIGFIIYRILLNTDVIIGATFLSILITIALTLIVEKITKRSKIK